MFKLSVKDHSKGIQDLKFEVQGDDGCIYIAVNDGRIIKIEKCGTVSGRDDEGYFDLHMGAIKVSDGNLYIGEDC